MTDTGSLPGGAPAPVPPDPLEVAVVLDAATIEQERRRAGALTGDAAEIEATVTGIEAALGGSIEVLDDMCGALRGLVEGAGTRAAQVSEDVDRGIAALMALLHTRTDARTADLTALDTIANKVRMLGLQASIEAGINSDHGGFDMVAVEVRRLATTIIETGRSVGSATDDRMLEQTAQQFRATFDTVVVAVEDATAAAVDDAHTGLLRAGQRLGDLRENQRVARALAVSLAEAAGRLDEKLSRAGAVVRAAAATATPNDGIEWLRPESGGDRLDRVLASGVLRVAVEPDFKGLSFRPPGTDSLHGLDIEYATAFARWLGTRIELIPYPWDRCPELLQAGASPGEQEADLVWSALPRVDAYPVPMALSTPYTYLPCVLARRAGDASIRGLSDLAGKVVGCIYDPSVMGVLERRGVRWAANADLPDGRIRVANLLAYSDQSRIHDCLTDGDVDAFVVDLPIYHWAATNPASPWCGRIEILPGNLDDDLWRYAVGAAADVDSARLLHKVDEFIAWYTDQPERAQLEQRWQGQVYAAATSRPDEHGVVTPADLLRRTPRSTTRAHQLTRRANDLALHASIAASCAASAAAELTERVAHIGTRLTESHDGIRHAADLPNALSTTITDQIRTRADTLRRPLDELIRQLGTSAAAARDTLTQITAVARQLQVLGLNAKFEAGRAGPAGRAFAVIAEEVHHLAITAAGLTEQIATTLDTTAVEDATTTLQTVTDTATTQLRTHLVTATSDAFSQLGSLTRGFDHANQLATQLTRTGADAAQQAHTANNHLDPAAQAQART